MTNYTHMDARQFVSRPCTPGLRAVSSGGALGMRPPLPPFSVPPMPPLPSGPSARLGPRRLHGVRLSSGSSLMGE